MGALNGASCARRAVHRVLADTAAALKALRGRVLVLRRRVGVVGLAGVLLCVVGSVQGYLGTGVHALWGCAGLGLWHASLG